MFPAARNSAPPALRVAASILLLPTAAALLLRFPPDRYSFYPRCPIYVLFHLQCPGCGATRALAALLRGDLLEALHQNALFTFALPVFLFWAACRYGRLKHKSFRSMQPPQVTVYAALVIVAVFTITRNLWHV
jgi:hypothetical protein